MQDLRVTIVQTKLHWEDIDANLSMLDEKLSHFNEPTDLIILPEMFSTGFSMNAKKLAEPMGGSAMQWMEQKSKQLKVVITGSLIIKENGKYFNRLIWMQPDGSYQTYNKAHLFSLANEQKTYSTIKKKLIVKLKEWNICPQICYDLRFPAWNRNLNDYDCLIIIANWPEKRSLPWNTLLMARAIENQSYVIGVNRVGDDGNAVYHSGNSAVIDPMGRPLFVILHDEEIRTVTLSGELLKKTRRAYPFLKDADKFKIN